MKIIAITQGLEVMVDDEDFEELQNHKWCAVRLGSRKTPYAARGVGKRLVLMHRAIMKPSNGLVVDHLNGDTLDNRRANLRTCTRQQNSFNKSHYTKHGGRVSRFKGVCWHERLKKWQAGIGFNGRKVHIGYFDSEEQAASAYNAQALLTHGAFASLNHVALPAEKRIKSPLEALG